MSLLTEKFKKYQWGLGLILIVGVLVAGAWYLMVTNVFVPEGFERSRQNSVFIAKNIVDLTEESLNNLNAIAEADKEYKFKIALILVREELDRITDAKVKASELTQELTEMSLAAAAIKPTRAKDLAVDAITHELNLIAELLIYNDSLHALLQTLEYKFSGDIRYDSDDVQKLVTNINQRTREVNKLNELFKEKMAEFDKIVEK